jgi:hypothetical protein
MKLDVARLTLAHYFNKHRSLELKRKAARSRGCGCAVKLSFVPTAAVLSRTVSDAYRRVISGIRLQHP